MKKINKGGIFKNSPIIPQGTLSGPSRSIHLVPFLKGDENKKAFTLVELIVVITILAILATIGFVSFSGYLAGTRDTNRVAQLKSMSDALELYRTKKDLPIPDDKVDIKANSKTIAYQGYIGKNVLETIEYTESGLDPKDKTYFSYYLTKNKKYFQLMAFLEEKNEDVQAFIPHPNPLLRGEGIIGNTFATDYSERYPKTTGKKLGILTDINNTPIQEVSTITGSGFLDISDVGNTEYKSFLKGDDFISGTGTTFAYLKHFAAVGGKFCGKNNIGCVGGLISNYPLQKNANNDFGDYNGIENGNINYTGEYAEFDGNSSISIGKDYNYTFNYNHPFTFSASIYLNSLDHHGTILSNNDNDDNAKGIGLLVNQNGTIYGELINNRGADNAISMHTDIVLNLNEWYHIVFTYDGSGKSSGISIYINGLKDKLIQIPNKKLITIDSLSTKNLLIGNRNYSGSNHYEFNGKIKNVKLFNKMISENDISVISNLDK